MVYVIYYEMHPELESPEGKARANWYGKGVESPLAFWDGTRRSPQVVIPDSFYPLYKSLTDAARAQKTILEIGIDSLTTTIDSAGLRIGVHITPTDSAVDTMKSLRLVAVVYEDSLPYYSLAQGDTVYSSTTVRQIVGGGFGIPLELKFGGDFDTILHTAASRYNITRVGAAVFVQDFETRAVLQSAGKRRIKTAVE